MTDVRHAAGKRGEELAAEHFVRLGFEVLARNHRTRFGELDLVVYDGSTLVFVRGQDAPLGDGREPWESLHDRKQSKVRRMAIAWLTEGPDRPYGAELRFDGVAVLLDGARRAGAARPPRGGVLMLARVITFAVDGVDARRVWVEADIRQGLPAFTVVGLADKAVREARERVRAAMVNSGFEFPLRRITVNLAPAYLRKVGPAFDLPLAVALLVASYQLEPEAIEGCAVVGELSLTGRGAAGARARWRWRRASAVPSCGGSCCRARGRGRRRWCRTSRSSGSSRCSSSSPRCAGTSRRPRCPMWCLTWASSRPSWPTCAATTG